MPRNLIVPTPNDADGFVSDGSDGVTFLKQFAYEGQFYKSADDLEFEITEDRIDHWVNVQSSLIGEDIEIPMPLEHTDNPEDRRATAIGFYKKKDSKGRVGLFGKVKFKSKKAAELAESAQTSIYVEDEITTPVKRTHHYEPITHVAFTDYPVLPGMDRFVAIAASLKATPVFPKESFKQKDVDMAEITLESLAEALDIEVVEFEDVARSFTFLRDATVKLKLEVEELKKKIPVTKEPPVIAASHRTMLTKNRKHDIDDLLRDGNITSAQAKSAEDKYLNDSCIVLSLSSESTIDDFEWWVENERLGNADPLHGDGDTGPQATVLKLSRADIKDRKKNPLLDACEAKNTSATG